MPVEPTPQNIPEPTPVGDSTLADLFRTHAATPGQSARTQQVDPHEVIRRSRRRRLPQRIGVGSALCLAVVGISVAGVTTAGTFGPFVSSSSDSASIAESGGTGDDTVDLGTGEVPANGPVEPESASGWGTGGSGISRAPADKINLCGGTLAEVAPAASGLVLTVEFAEAPADGSPVDGTATLTNSGSTTVTGYSAAAPAITLSQDGVVTWHSNGPTIMSITDITLAPGESMSYPASFTPVVCSVEDDLGESFGDALPVASAGEYQVSAALDVTTNAGEELVTGPVATIILH